MKRGRLITILFAAVVLGFLTIAFFRDREPHYQGRCLSGWIAQGRSAYFQFLRQHPPRGNTISPDENVIRFLATDPDWQAASHAIRQMAPAAIPVLVKWIRAQDSPLRQKIASWLNAHPSLHLHLKTEVDRDKAYWGFALLGDEAKPARLELIGLTYAPNATRCRVCALGCLFESEPDKTILLPVLLRMLHDPLFDIQINAALELHRRFPEDAETAGVYKLFPEVKNFPTYLTTINQPQNK